VPPSPRRGSTAQTPFFNGRGPIHAAQYRQTGRPHRWGRRVPRKWVHRLEPRISERHRKGAVSLWTRVRRLILAWWPWSVICLYSLVTDRWGWATVTGWVALVNYLMTPEEFPPVYGLDHEFAIESDEFLHTVSGATATVFASNKIDLLNNGDEFYPEMLSAIESAEASVTIEAYIYWAGDIGQKFARALARRAAAGVSVKILLDAVGSASIGSEILETLESGGCQLAWYNRIRWYSIGRFNHRTHRKSVIVDGRVGFTGGAGIADVWIGHAQDSQHWRDMQIRVEGPAVVPLQTGFAANWLQTTGELITGPRYYPPPDGDGALAALTVMSSPETGASTVRTMYYLSIVCARKSIYIANPYFIPDATAVETLIDAKRRGVDVRIMVAGAHNDNWLARRNSVMLFGKLLEADVQVLEYNRTLLHHKTMVVDGIWTTIGTTNFDNRSFAHNEESNVCIYDRTVAGKLQETFLADMRDCERLSFDQWRKRGIWSRAQEVVASFLQDQA
jgi:cardiolipin synthase A/B